MSRIQTAPNSTDNQHFFFKIRELLTLRLSPCSYDCVTIYDFMLFHQWSVRIMKKFNQFKCRRWHDWEGGRRGWGREGQDQVQLRHRGGVGHRWWEQVINNVMASWANWYTLLKNWCNVFVPDCTVARGMFLIYGNESNDTNEECQRGREVDFWFHIDLAYRIIFLSEKQLYASCISTYYADIDSWFCYWHVVFCITCTFMCCNSIEQAKGDRGHLSDRGWEIRGRRKVSSWEKQWGSRTHDKGRLRNFKSLNLIFLQNSITVCIFFQTTLDQKMNGPYNVIVGESFSLEIDYVQSTLMYMFFGGYLAIMIWKCVWCAVTNKMIRVLSEYHEDVLK